MKLYVWVNPYNVSYGHSMVFAVAESVEDARAIASQGKLYELGKFEAETEMAAPKIASELGEPDRIVDLPCAEWHEWSE